MQASLPKSAIRPRARTIAAWAFLVSSPFWLLLLASLLKGHSALASVPVWTDELDYWRAVYSWLHVGFGAGYSGIGELTARLGTLSVHGIAPILLYALPASLFGWSYASIVILNSAWISLGALVYVLLCRPKALAAVLLGAGLMIYAPVILYCVTSMTELANYGLLLMYLALLAQLYQSRHRARELPAKRRSLAGGIALLACTAVVLLCCAYRITYVVLWLPLLWIAFDGKPSMGLLMSLLLMLLLTAGLYVWTARMASPFAAGFLYNLLRTGDVGLSVQMFLSHGKANLMDYFILPPGNPMEAAQRMLYCGMMALTLLGSWVRVQRVDGRTRLVTGLNRLNAMAFLMLFLPFLIVVSLYETNDWADYRTLAPFLWLVFAACVTAGRKALPALFLAGSAAVLVFLFTLAPVGAFSDAARFTPAAPSAEMQELASAIPYEPDAADPFRNTVRTDLFTLDTVRLLHPGLGIQTGWFTEDSVGKSEWVLTDYLKIPLEGYTLVVKNGSGSVYRRVAP